MSGPLFLSLRNVLDLHADSIATEGGFPGTRDPGLLESAVMMPQQQFGGDYLHGDLETMAAAYLYHLAANHPFLDGNKRVAAMAAFVFLDVNGIHLTASPESFEALVMAVASGAASKDAVIAWLKGQTRPRARTSSDPGL